MNVDKVVLIGNVAHYCLLKIQTGLKMIVDNNGIVDQNICALTHLPNH